MDKILISSMFLIGEATKSDSFVVTAINASNHRNHRTFGAFICNDCDRERKTFVYVGNWTCRECSQLPYRVQLIGSGAAKWEELTRLRREVGDGRPKGMHNRTYQAKRGQLRALKKELGPERLVASSEFKLVISGQWLDPMDDIWTPTRAPLPEYSRTTPLPVGKRQINFRADSFDGLTE